MPAYSKRLYPSLQKNNIKLPDTVDFLKNKLSTTDEMTPPPPVPRLSDDLRFATLSPSPKSRAEKSYKTGGGFDVGKT